MKNTFILFFSISLFSFLYAGESTNVLIVYYSNTGNTKTLAEAVEDGAKSVTGASTKLLDVTETSTEDLVNSDAIILGSPVYNANVVPEMQEFINNWPFKGAPLKNKIGAAFVTAGGMSAGEELVQLNLLHSMLIFGMVIVGGDEWNAAFGASAITEETPFDESEIDSTFLDKGYKLGKRVAEISLKFKLAETE